MKFLLSVLVVSILAISCGTGESDRSESDRNRTEPNSGSSSSVTLKNNICKVIKDKAEDFEITCPSDIKNFSYLFMSGGKGLNLSGTINGVQMDLNIANSKDDPKKLTGRTTNKGIEVTLALADGKTEVLVFP